MLRTVSPALSALLFVLALGLCSSRGWAQGGERLSLDGTWAFTVEAAQLDRPLESWDRLPVPGNWDTTNRYAQHVGPGWYRRLFTLPDGWQGRRVRLCFEAVYETAEVFLNGRSLGRHQGGYTPFEFDITHLARADQANELTVCADNTYRRGAWWAWGGISRGVSLAPATRPTARSAPTNVRAYPLDGGFMLGYSTQPDDTTFTVEYGLVPGAPDQTLTIAQKGAFSVTPDGQMAPAAPTVLAAVRGTGLIALRFAPVDKATAYRVRWGATERESRLIEAAVPGPVVLAGFVDQQRVTFTVTALRGSLESTPSAAITVEPAVASAPQSVKP